MLAEGLLNTTSRSKMSQPTSPGTYSICYASSYGVTRGHCQSQTTANRMFSQHRSVPYFQLEWRVRPVYRDDPWRREELR